jgi:hypothetical protein
LPRRAAASVAADLRARSGRQAAAPGGPSTPSLCLRTCDGLHGIEPGDHSFCFIAAPAADLGLLLLAPERAKQKPGFRPEREGTAGRGWKRPPRAGTLLWLRLSDTGSATDARVAAAPALATSERLASTATVDLARAAVVVAVRAIRAERARGRGRRRGEVRSNMKASPGRDERERGLPIVRRSALGWVKARIRPRSARRCVRRRPLSGKGATF